MKKYKIIDMPLAKSDIRGILAHLHRISPSIALKYASYIKDTINSLSTMPNRCALVRSPALRKLGYRWISTHNYMIFFLVEEEDCIVRIERVLYSRQEYATLL